MPELVRTGDTYDARFTLRNGTDKPMEVTATPTLSPAVATAPPLTVTIPAGAAVPISWSMTAPEKAGPIARSEEHTSELQSLMRISYAVFCLKKKNHINKTYTSNPHTYSKSLDYHHKQNQQTKTQ